jgi:hypothetical protein
MGRFRSHKERCKGTRSKPLKLEAKALSFGYLCVLRRYQSLNYEGHEGRRRKINRNFVDRLLLCMALWIFRSLVAPKSVWASGHITLLA